MPRGEERLFLHRPAIALGLALSLALLALSLASTPAHALTNCTVSDAAVDSEEQAFLTLINQYRASHGLATLAISPELQRAANWMASDMGNKNYFGHTDSLGRSPWTRMADCGVAWPGGENVAGGTTKSSGADAFEMFRNSPAHNDNMLFAGFRQVGIARVNVPGSRLTWYWVTDFGYPSPAAPATPTAEPTAAPAPKPTVAAPSGGTAGAAAVANPSGPAPLQPPAPVVPAIGFGAGLRPFQWPLASITPAEFMTRTGGHATVLASHSRECGCYAIYSPLLPDWFNTLPAVLQGQSYWAVASSPATVQLDD